MPGVGSYIDDIVTEFLGNQVGVITLSRGNLKRVQNTPPPTIKKQVRSFLSLLDYYRDHIPAFSEITAPLTDLLKKGKAEHIQWSEAQERAYSLLKEYLLQKQVLKLPDMTNLCYGRTYAELVWRLCYFRKTTRNYIQWATPVNLTKARYPIIEKEWLMVVWGIKRFKL